MGQRLPASCNLGPLQIPWNVENVGVCIFEAVVVEESVWVREDVGKTRAQKLLEEE